MTEVLRPGSRTNLSPELNLNEHPRLITAHSKNKQAPVCTQVSMEVKPDLPTLCSSQTQTAQSTEKHTPYTMGRQLSDPLGFPETALQAVLKQYKKKVIACGKIF